jgi:rhamnulose-1-phosphate aldolase
MNEYKNLTLDEVLMMIGEAGHHIANINASEGAAGNISVCLREPIDVCSRFPVEEGMRLPQSVPELAGATLIVSGSGRRLREIQKEPTAHLACLVVNEDGQTARKYTAHHHRFRQLTSEFNSHLAVHYDQMNALKTNFHAVIHAQPVNLTYLSHIPRYQDFKFMNSHLLRWQPETIVHIPEGIGYIPFRVPGSARLMKDTVQALQQHQIVIWGKHGVMARSEHSVKKAADCVDYVETAAVYELLNLHSGDRGEGMNLTEIREVCETFGITQKIF